MKHPKQILLQKKRKKRKSENKMNQKIMKILVMNQNWKEILKINIDIKNIDKKQNNKGTSNKEKNVKVDKINDEYKEGIYTYRKKNKEIYFYLFYKLSNDASFYYL